MFNSFRTSVSRKIASWLGRTPAAPLTRAQKKQRRKEVMRRRGGRV
jgi:hypothetical protein